jgi:transcription initiation factor TFIID subunit 2
MIAEPTAGRGFRMAHQKVSIDVNLAEWTLEGWTELTIVPTDPLLKQIVLDCRQCRIHGVSVNGKKAVFFHDDILRGVNLNEHASVNQHHQY